MTALCAIEGCERPRRARDWCTTHYTRWQRHGDPTHVERRPPTDAPCAVEGCGRAVVARGWCHGHWKRWKLHGDVLADVPFRAPLPRYCAVRGCRRPAYARNLCTGHVSRLYKLGDVRADQPLGHRRTAPKRWPAIALLEATPERSARDIARALGQPSRSAERWAKWMLTNAEADRFAMALGHAHPGDVWAEWWEVAA